MALQHRPDIETLASAIAHSPIVVARALTQQPCLRARLRADSLPEGFEDVDLAVLRWIAQEGRRVSRALARI
jgi:hypothetical protein